MITGIGSLPLADIDKAIDMIFDVCSEVPFWPQLPKRSPDENMYNPFLENVPSVVYDKNSVFVNTEETEGIEKFYEYFEEKDISKFAISEKMSPGFYRFLDRIDEVSDRVKFIKCQITGPFSMGLGLKDEKGVPIIYNYGYYDIIKKSIHMKARWMVDKIKSKLPDKEIIIFFDEPYMVSFGSAYVSINKDDAISIFDEVLTGIEAIRGVHCCGNTDWSVLLNTKVDIINYDAFNYLETIFYFRDDLKGFLKRGGFVSPGIVPSSEIVMEKNLKDMEELLFKFKGHLKGVLDDSNNKELLVTTSCGLGSLSEEAAEKAMMLLKELSVESKKAI